MQLIALEREGADDERQGDRGQFGSPTAEPKEPMAGGVACAFLPGEFGVERLHHLRGEIGGERGVWQLAQLFGEGDFLLPFALFGGLGRQERLQTGFLFGREFAPPNCLSKLLRFAHVLPFNLYPLWGKSCWLIVGLPPYTRP